MTLEDRALRPLVAGWAGTGQARRLDAWHSRTARLTLWDANGVQLLVKQLETAELAARLYDVMCVFADVAPPGVTRLRPLGWSDDPPCVCMPYVDAPSLRTLIKRERFLWKASPIEDVVTRVGTALACFHDATRDADWISRDDADVQLSWALQHAGPHAAALRAAADSAASVRVYDDINPSHVLVHADTITLIDLPSGTKVAHPHRDLAWFADQLLMTLLRSLPRAPASRQLAHFAKLRQRLLVSYFAQTGSPLTDPDDQLVAAFENFYLARRERSGEHSPIASRLFRALRNHTRGLRSSSTRR